MINTIKLIWTLSNGSRSVLFGLYLQRYAWSDQGPLNSVWSDLVCNYNK